MTIEMAPVLTRETTKVAILDEVADELLELPALLRRALEANERAKYLLSLLQTAKAHADDPSLQHTSLRAERIAAGVLDSEFDQIVERSQRIDEEHYQIPHASRVLESLHDAVLEMLEPLVVARFGGAPDRPRLDALERQLILQNGDEVVGQLVDALTASRETGGDSMHQLIMDAHHALNGLEAEIATSSVDGAATFGIVDEDRSAVAAFMAGVHETEVLKLDHPGLGTTAMRCGPRLLIQNDLGTTNAHVLVVAVEGCRATVTHADVHARRLAFFKSMLDGFNISWSDDERRVGGPKLGDYHLVTGVLDAEDRVVLEAFLQHVGSRCAFLLDWNRARKRLATIASRDDAVRLLRWAADEGVGHMAWLQLGAERLVDDAVELASAGPIRYGEPLNEVLGRDTTLDVVRFSMRAASEGIRAGKSALLIRDEVRVEVQRHLRAWNRQLLDASAEHASLVVECAKALEACVIRLGSPASASYVSRAAIRAADWEHRADEILKFQRVAARSPEGASPIATFTTSADDAIDVLEEAVFLLGLVPVEAAEAIRAPLERITATSAMAAREHLKAVELARRVVAESDPEELEDFLVAIDRVDSLEHEADENDRLARAALVTCAPEFRSLYVADGISRCAEDATDALLRSALGLRDHVLSLLSGR